MSRIVTAIDNDLKLIGLLRDEARLQAHLLKAEARIRFDELEQQWEDLKVRLERVEVSYGQARQEAEAAVSLLAESLKNGYSAVREALTA